MSNHKSQSNDEESESQSSPKKAKGRSKRRDTITRKDVVQKTIFRALRKEYEHFFHLFLNFKEYPANYGIDQFRTYLSEFVEYIMEWEDQDELEIRFGEFKHLSFIIGLMVDFCKVKKFDKSGQERDLSNQFYDSLYKYSHTKFEKLLEIPEVKFLFNKMLDDSYIDTFIARHDTLSKNVEDYKKCAKSILSTLNQ